MILICRVIIAVQFLKTIQLPITGVRTKKNDKIFIGFVDVAYVLKNEEINIKHISIIEVIKSIQMCEIINVIYTVL